MYKQKCLRELKFAENRERCSLLEQMFAILGLEGKEKGSFNRRTGNQAGLARAFQELLFVVKTKQRK